MFNNINRYRIIMDGLTPRVEIREQGEYVLWADVQEVVNAEREKLREEIMLTIPSREAHLERKLKEAMDAAFEYLNKLDGANRRIMYLEGRVPRYNDTSGREKSTKEREDLLRKVLDMEEQLRSKTTVVAKRKWWQW